MCGLQAFSSLRGVGPTGRRPVDINLVLAACPNIYDLGFFSAKPNQFLKKIINIGALGNVVVNEKDISFHKKPEALLPEVFESAPVIRLTCCN
jgi:hypothetical protein